MAEKDRAATNTASKSANKGGDADVAEGPKTILGLTIPVLAFAGLNLITMLSTFAYIYHAKFIYKAPVITESETKVTIKAQIEKEEKAKIAADGVVRIYTLPEMHINLRPKVGGRNHYATITIAVKCNNESCMEEVKVVKAKIEDTIQSLIASRSYPELTMSEASFRLKHEITKSINAILKRGTVTDTYFTDYTVQ